MNRLPDDVLQYVMLDFLLPVDILKISTSSKYIYDRLDNNKKLYLTFSQNSSKLLTELKSKKTCNAYLSNKNFKCRKNRSYESSFCSRHEKLWYEDDTTDEWWVPLQM